MVEHCSENFTDPRISKTTKSPNSDQQVHLMDMKHPTMTSSSSEWPFGSEVDYSCRPSNYSGGFIVHLQGNTTAPMVTAVELNDITIPEMLNPTNQGNDNRSSRVIGCSNSSSNNGSNSSNNNILNVTNCNNNTNNNISGINNINITNFSNTTNDINHHHTAQMHHHHHHHHHHHTQPHQQHLHSLQLQPHHQNSVIQDEHKPFVCAGCGDLITERYYLNVANNAWHFNCLKCYECKSTLDTERSCYERMGNYYCKDDYQRLFNTQRCARCGMGIQSTDLVMRAKNHIYHVSCFTCFTCNKALQAGDTFGLREHFVYCQIHYEDSYQSEYISLSPDINTNQAPYYNGVGTLQKGRPRKRRSPNLNSEEFAQNMGLGHEGLDRSTDHLDRDTYQNAPRQKRMRTSFKHHQLRALKSYFAVNHNPDAKDLKHLAQKTNLTKRVLQVWFQNARAKYRRNCQKQDQDRGPGNNQPGLTPSNQSSENGSNSEIQTVGDLSIERSPGLSDISSTHSLQGSCLDSDQSNSLSDFLSGNFA
ncbi:LIM/homeobox protein Lhx9-like [Argonauta hians]